ncbi:hypothetical protein ON010_g18386 [Phytophthora cinnamomi]|nr:hypothetical protein ON010_g18386 [Phytophthora cinnamomi]
MKKTIKGATPSVQPWFARLLPTRRPAVPCPSLGESDATYGGLAHVYFGGSAAVDFGKTITVAWMSPTSPIVVAVAGRCRSVLTSAAAPLASATSKFRFSNGVVRWPGTCLLDGSAAVDFGAVAWTSPTSRQLWRLLGVVDLVQPESNIDVDVDIQATDDLDPVIGEVAEVERPNDQDADEAAQVAKMPPVGDAELEAARFRRFCVLADKLVPNKDIWSKVYHPPADVFAPEELPFEEKKNWCWKFWDSLMFPCIASTIAMLASMFTLYSYIVSLQLSRVVSAPDVRSNWGVKVLTAGPLVFAIGALPVLSEHPARLLLYYRLWERKVVINFKERDITDPATMRQMGLIGIIIIAGYALYGWRSEYVSDKWSYTFIVLQSLGAMGLTIYQTLPVESWLQGVNEAFRHYQNNDTEKHGERSYRYQDKVVKAFEQVQFVPERKRIVKLSPSIRAHRQQRPRLPSLYARKRSNG